MHDTPPPKAVQTCTCQGCNAEWTRPTVRGQRPRWCPACQGKQMKTCGTCGKRAPITRHTKNCDPCWETIQRARLEKKLPVPYAGPKHVAPPIVHAKSARRFNAGQCRTCGAGFVTTGLWVTCSTECGDAYGREQRSLHKTRRATRKRGAYVADVSRRKVYEADGYRCHICNRKTDPTKPVPHPKAPTIDHVIPLALGGTHEPVNCRTACFRCNSTKGHTGHGDQMLLIAV